MAHVLPSQILSTCDKGIFYCFADWANDVTSGAFWALMLLAFAFVIFMATLRFGTHRAFSFGSWVGLIGGIWLAIMQLIAWWVASAFILVGVVGIAVSMMMEREGG